MKKIFAVVLSLCLVLSSFVAVSAAEQVYNEGVYNEGIYNEGTSSLTNTYANINENFDAGMGDALAGTPTLITVSAGTVAGREGQVLVLDSNDTTKAWGAVAGFEVKDAGDTVYTVGTFPTSGTITYSFDVMVPDTTMISDSSFFLRAAGSFPPSGQQANLNTSFGLESGVWKTITGTKEVADLNWQNTSASTTPKMYLVFRPNFTSTDGVMYIDNVSFKIEETKYVDYITNMSEDFETEMGAVQVGKNAISGQLTTIGGRNVVAATTTGSTSHDGLVGMQLLNADGETYKLKDADADAIVQWSVDIMIPEGTTGVPVGNSKIILRDGGWTPSGELVTLGSFGTQYMTPGEWKTFSGITTVADLASQWSGSASGGTWFALRPNYTAANTFYVDNMSIKVYTEVAEEDVVEPGWEVEPGWDVEPGWETPDNSIPATIKLMNIPGTASGNNFSFAMSEVAEYFSTQTASNNSYTATIAIIPDTPVAKDSNWTIEADLVMDGLVDSTGATNVWVRCVDNTTTATQGKTVGYVQKGVTVEDGTIHLVFSSDDMIAGGGTSTSSTIAMFGISFDSSQICNYTDLTANTGSYAYNNVTIVSEGLKLDYAKNGADLKITNNNADKYKFTGRVFFAEYLGNQLVQFYSAGEVSEEITAGSSVTVENGFENAVAAGNTLKIFVWETGSMVPAMDPVE